MVIPFLYKFFLRQKCPFITSTPHPPSTLPHPPPPPPPPPPPYPNRQLGRRPVGSPGRPPLAPHPSSTFLIIKIPNPHARLHDLPIQVIELPLCLEERIRPQVLRELLLQRLVLRRRRKQASCRERPGVLQCKILLKVEGGDFSKARNEGFPLAPKLHKAAAQSARIQGSIGLPLLSSGVVANALEPPIRLHDRHRVRLDVDEGDVEEGLREMDLQWGVLVVDGYAMGDAAMVDGSREGSAMGAPSLKFAKDLERDIRWGLPA